MVKNYTPGTGGYQEMIDDAVANNDFVSAAKYEQLRNEKIAKMNAANANPNNYTATDLYSKYLNGGTTPAQDQAQAISPATYSQRAANLDSVANRIMNTQTPAYQAPDTSSYDRQLAQALSDLQNRQFVAPDWKDYENNKSLNDYVNEQIQLLQPTYQEQYGAAAAQASQNLDRAGIYNSLYGQSILQNAENGVTRAMMTDATNQARQARQQDYENAFRQYQTDIDNARFAFSSEGERLNTVINSLHNSIGEVLNKASMSNNYQLQAAAQEIQRQAAAADMLYQAGMIQAQEYANMLAQEQIKSEQMDREMTQMQMREMAGVIGSIYNADANGKAPEGLSIGDYVKTKDTKNGQYYRITGYKPDGGYLSEQMPVDFDPYALRNPINATSGSSGGGYNSYYSRSGSDSSSELPSLTPVYDSGTTKPSNLMGGTTNSSGINSSNGVNFTLPSDIGLAARTSANALQSGILTADQALDAFNAALNNSRRW